MADNVLARRTRLPHPAGDVFAWHERPGAFERLSPPFFPMRVVERSGPALEPGATARLAVPIAGPLTIPWVAEHVAVERPTMFRDVQRSGPFTEWRHTHRFEPDGPDACYLEDEIEYTLPGGRMGQALAAAMIRRRLEEAFAYRHRVTAGDLDAHRRAGLAPMRIAITGASGVIGTALSAYLGGAGHTVVPVTRSRRAPGEDAIAWRPSEERIDAAAFEDVDAVVHLAGEPLLGLWTAGKKERIMRSREAGTRLLAETLAGLRSGPRVLVSASAIGIYGPSRGDETLTEDSALGGGFLAEVCRRWEAATEPARAAGIRTVLMRNGLVLTPAGGLLQPLWYAFSAGLGGPIGGGAPWWSWIAIDDEIRAIEHALATDGLDGPVNATAPNPVTNAVFTETLGRVLRRPAVLPVPARAIELLLQEAGSEVVLADQRVLPERLLESGFTFAYPVLEDALRHLLGRTEA